MHLVKQKLKYCFINSIFNTRNLIISQCRFVNQKNSKNNELGNDTFFDEMNGIINQSLGNSENNDDKKSVNDLFGDTCLHPREVAKNLRIYGPISGRVVDVHNHNLNQSLNALNRVVTENRIKHYQKIESRYIKPGKYKVKKKIENRKNFFMKGFKSLIEDLHECKRRGF